MAFDMNKERRRLDAERLIKSVVTVYERFAANKMKPGSMHWEINTHTSRPKVLAKVMDEWRQSSDDVHWFPYAEDYVIRFWATYRRLKKPEKLALRISLGLEESAVV